MGEELVAVSSLSKTYGETKALIDVNLQFHAGEVHALMGENGSGKSTLVKLISGIVRPTSGEIRITGKEMVSGTPREAIARGIGTIHQDSAIAGELTVAQNIMLGHEQRTFGGILSGGTRSTAQPWLDAIQTDIDPDALAGSLSIAGKQLVAIAKALSNESRVIIFDEPTAALGDAETEHLLAQIDTLRSQGIGIIYISHRIAEVRRIADKISVLKDGRLTHSGINDLDEADIIRLMIGREPEALFPTLKPPLPKEVLAASGLGSADGLVKVQEFVVHHGEVVGIAGLEGSGRDTLARLLGGVERAKTGTLSIKGRVLDNPSPSSSVKAGITFVPPDRRRQAVIDEFSVAKTITQPAMRKFATLGVLLPKAEFTAAKRTASEMGVKAADIRQSILTLSGGNQQKAILGRAIASESEVLVCDEPTAGVDVGSRADIYGRFAELAAEGLGIVLSSSDMVELIGMCHRIVVIREGHISAIFSADEATEEKLMAAQLPSAERLFLPTKGETDATH